MMGQISRVQFTKLAGFGNPFGPLMSEKLTDIWRVSPSLSLGTVLLETGVKGSYKRGRRVYVTSPSRSSSPN
jgi:hypothetical protein